ncbi:DNA mismatch repair protein MutS [Magnaporthiopsis poae ATCC 64411]|uniref:DNA mismatch repair protein MSH5 n=1 Tax=Magnaporthiopsis poae (strain ATCC 64411 / 73-15) TaxID=644358 RepID=A0A0C4E2A8_MAGP6|nr:DNA mismatch repair protein MutS [Magnaporthiopsis poae ATCC 64411]
MSSDRRSTPRGLKRPQETPPSSHRRPARRQNITSSSAPPPSFNSRHPQTLSSTPPPPHSEEGPRALAESDSVTEHDEDESSQDHVILALDLRNNGDLGSAYYTSVDDTLFVQQDTSGGMELVELLVLHVQPTVVLVPNRASDELVSYLEKSAPGINGSSYEGSINGAYIFRVTGSSEFEPHRAKARLTKLKLEPFSNPDILMTTAGECDPMVLEEDRPHLGQVQASLRLGSLISLQSHLSIGSAGAVIGELQRRTASEYLVQDPGVAPAHKITSVRTFNLADSMLVNQDTLDALQITRTESHPNRQMSNPSRGDWGAKEGLSVYGLFQKHACTLQGKIRLKQAFLRPSTDIQLLRERHRTVAVLMRPENSETCHLLTKKLKTIRNMKTVMANVQKGVDKPSSKTPAKKGVWQRLRYFAKSSVEIFELVRNLAMGENMMREMSAEVDPSELMKIGVMISNTVDFEASGVANQTVVCHGVDQTLDELRRQFSGMESFLVHVSEELALRIPQWATQYIQRCVYYRQLGFLTVIARDPATGKSLYDGSGAPSKDHWEAIFEDDDGNCYKNNYMRELDESHGDIESDIDGRQIEILNELRLKVMAHKDGILSTSRFWGELDCFVAMAGAARQYGLSMPQMTDENVIDIKDGRHLLQELVVPSFIANDCQLAGGSGREGILTPNGQDCEKKPSMLILTGPNHSGKSVFLKQVALIVYLAHVGSFVPAERARLGIVDKILTRITTRESVTGDESAFATDLRQAAFAMSLATCRSLVLADEFGKGTNPIDGAALAAALFEYFATRDEDKRPKVLAATHFHEIFEQGVLDETPNISYAHMAIRAVSEATKREDQITFLYNLVPGRSTSSYGIWCASMNGVDEKVVKRAEVLSAHLEGGGNISAITRLSGTEEKRLEVAERAAREFMRANIATPGKEGGSEGLEDDPPAEQPRDLLKRILAMYDEVDVPVDGSGDPPPPDPPQSEIS